MSLGVDVISDVICPWCYIGKRRPEKAVAAVDRPVGVRWLPFQLNPALPREGVSSRESSTPSGAGSPPAPASVVAGGLVAHPGDDRSLGPPPHGDAFGPGHGPAADRRGVVGHGPRQAAGDSASLG
jgi:hypothetical protein